MATSSDQSIETQLGTLADHQTSLESSDVFRVDPEEDMDQQMEKLMAELNELPQEMRISLDINMLKRNYQNAKSISILVTGKTGTGKSTLANGILGVKIQRERVAIEGANITGACTTKVTKYEARKGEIAVTLWDSPGLQDGTANQTDYLRQMKQQCSKRDLTIYCIKMIETRFVQGTDNPDIIAMKKITKAFGNDFWKSTVIVLTFANSIEAVNYDIKYLSPEKKIEEIKKVISQWINQIKNILIKDVKIPKEIVKSILIVPAGHYMEPHIPGCRYWLSNLWFHCVHAISSPEAKVALVKINFSRIKREDLINDEDFQRAPEEQPIVVNKEAYSTILRGVLGAIGGGLAGAGVGVGVGVGTVGLILPISLPVGIVLGVLIGFVACV